MQEKIGSWSLVVTKSRDQENYPSRLLVTSVKTPSIAITRTPRGTIARVSTWKAARALRDSTARVARKLKVRTRRN
jgi:hypothetical protein